MPNLPIKLTQISKDFNIKSKDLLDSFKELGIEKKTGGSADKDEFELFLATLTAKHQIKDLDAYREGRATIKSVEEKKAAPAPKVEEKPQPKVEEKSQPKVEARPEQKPQPKAETRPQPQQRPQQAGQPQQRNNDRRDQRPDRQGRDDRRGGFNKYSAAPQENPFAKKHDNMNRQAQGLRNPNSQWQKPEQKPVQKPQTPAPQPAPKVEAKQPVVLPAQKAALEKQQAQAQKVATPAPQPKPKKEEKKAQKQQFKTLTPTVKQNVKGGVNVGVEYVNEAAPKTRIVDTRTHDVNLSKYDDRYNDHYYSILNGGDSKAQKQKLKKQDNRGQNQKSAKDKERAAQEKIKRMEAERARNKQLEITVPDEITVSELASRMKKTAAEVIKI